jgi:Spy/CpxP family protein refolding chaperone
MGMQRGGPQGDRQQGPNPERLKEAGATDEQLEQLKKIQEQQQLKQVDLKADAEKAQIELKQLISSENASEKDVLKAVDALTEAKAAIMKQGISARFKAREILGDEISKKLREMGPPKGRGPDGQKGPGVQRPQGPQGRGAPGGPSAGAKT